MVVKKGKVALIALLVVLGLVLVWATALFSSTNAQKQSDLIAQAEDLLADRTYLRAQPLLEEAVGYAGEQTLYAEELLKKVYRALIDEQGYATKYQDLLETQMVRADAAPEVFLEAAEYYQGKNMISEGIAALRDGAEKTADPAVVDAYEAARYQYRAGRVAFDQISEVSGGMRQVELDGLWGMTDLSGELTIPCQYKKISTCCNDLVIVQDADGIYSVDTQGHRMYVPHEAAVTDFKNYANDRVPVLLNGAWHRATGTWQLGTTAFEDMGMYADGYAAAKVGGKWGVVDLSDTWLLPAEYDGIAMDELGHCIGQGAVFASQGGRVQLLTDGQATGCWFEDAQPFQEDGFAAVQSDGKWGFIDTTGALQIPCQFESARSFHQGLAAVQIGDRWGYIRADGTTVIEPVFYDAKSFCDGYAPVETEHGWTIIQLYEYEEN